MSLASTVFSPPRTRRATGLEGVRWNALPWGLLVCSAALFAISLSAMARSSEMQGEASLVERQIRWAILGAIAGVLAATIPYRWWTYRSYTLLGLSLPLLVVVLAMPPRNGARCWISLGWFDVQPSEIVKLTLVLALARFLMHRASYRRISGLWPPFVMTLVPLALILKEPDLGSGLVFLPLLMAMLIGAGARWQHLLCVVLFGVCCTPLFWLGMNAEQRSRVTALFAQPEAGAKPDGDGYHQHQSKLVHALGGAWGSAIQGTVVDDPAAYHLPAGQTDFIFCWVGERWGLAGGLLVLALYAGQLTSGLSIAGATREPYGRLVATGLVAILATQTIVNTGMTVGLLPVTGITLPLMSYGGSSFVLTCVFLGLLVNIALRPGYQLAGEPFRFHD